MASTPQTPSTEDLWRAYEAAQRHYDADHQLFSARMNLFLLVQTGLLATSVATGKRGSGFGGMGIAVFGLTMSVAWLAVALSSYQWIKTWRAHVVDLAQRLKDATGIEVSGRSFVRGNRAGHTAHSSPRHRLLEKASWYVRPTVVTCCLPLIFLVSWAIAIGVNA